MTKNYLAIDYGTRHFGLAYSQKGIISTLLPIANDNNAIAKISEVVNQYHVVKIYVGLSQGRVADLTLKFVSKLRRMLKLPVETVEEAVSTIEAEDILKASRNRRKTYSGKIDSVSAAVILRRVIS